MALGLGLGVSPEDFLDAGQARLAPGEMILDHVAQGDARVDDPRIDGQQRPLLRESRYGLMQLEVGSDQMKQVLGVSLIHDNEVRVESQSLVMDAQETVGDGMKGPTPN